MYSIIQTNSIIKRDNPDHAVKVNEKDKLNLLKLLDGIIETAEQDFASLSRDVILRHHSNNDDAVLRDPEGVREVALLVEQARVSFTELRSIIADC